MITDRIGGTLCMRVIIFEMLKKLAFYLIERKVFCFYSYLKIRYKIHRVTHRKVIIHDALVQVEEFRISNVQLCKIVKLQVIPSLFQ